MAIRTDLVLEETEVANKISGVEISEEHQKDITVTYTEIKSDTAAKMLSKPRGKYVTIEFKSLSQIIELDDIEEKIVKALNYLLPNYNGNILVVGLGNNDITPDALGPLSINKIFATRHIDDFLAENLGLKGLKKVSAIAPSVLGKTGIETAELIASAVKTVKPSAVITIDALAARKPERLLNTIQLTDTGISPGSGVKNSRKAINYENLKVPVIAIGVPTVVDINPDESMLLTHKDIDLLIKEAAEVISNSVNIFSQPSIEKDLILRLV